MTTPQQSKTPETDATWRKEAHSRPWVDAALAMLDKARSIEISRDDANQKLKTNIEIRKAVDNALVECSKERDEWKKVAEELAEIVELYKYRHTKGVGAIHRYQSLKEKEMK